MKRNKLIPVLTAVIISSCFLVSCSQDNNTNNQDAHSMDPAKMEADIDTNTGTRTGNLYAEEEEITVSENTDKARVNARGDTRLMENPSAVEHAEQGTRQKPATYINKPEGYVDEPARVPLPD